MTTNSKSKSVPHQVDRRNFLRSVAAVSAGAASLSPLRAGLFAGLEAEQTAETAVGEFYKSLTDKQRQVICLPFNHDLRNRINANWHITKPELGDDFFADSQRGIVREILKGISSEDGFKRLETQMDEDAGGLAYFSVAVFGTPGDGKFEFELTGRHLTLRADGNSVDHAAFGGPIVYGHGEEDPKKNLYYYQTEQTDKVFKALSSEQTQKALVAKAPQEAAVQIQGQNGAFPGISVAALSTDQRELVKQTLEVLLAPYRKQDVNEVMEILNASGGIEGLHMAFYQQGDLNADKQWDIWRVEGPSFVWHFRGAPHVHAYINIGGAKG
ncbi:MAG: DUF3500 domain-containing protein [Planctomycetaceae bacterium]